MKINFIIIFSFILLLIGSCGQSPVKEHADDSTEIVLDTLSPLQSLIETANSERRMCRASKECVIDNTCDLKTKSCKNTGETCKKNIDCEIRGTCDLRVCRF